MLVCQVNVVYFCTHLLSNSRTENKVWLWVIRRCWKLLKQKTHRWHTVLKPQLRWRQDAWPVLCPYTATAQAYQHIHQPTELHRTQFLPSTAHQTSDWTTFRSPCIRTDCMDMFLLLYVESCWRYIFQKHEKVEKIDITSRTAETLFKYDEMSSNL